MADETTPTPFGSGGRNRDYPAIDPVRRETLINFFNRDTTYFPGHLGLKIADLRQGYSRLEVTNDKHLMQAGGVMHGGASFGLADTATAVALMTIYPLGTMLLTIEMKINYLEPIPAGLVTAEAYILRSSKRSAYAEIDIWAAGKLAARASTTYMIRPAE